jgi:hypothetical protein
MMLSRGPVDNRLPGLISKEEEEMAIRKRFNLCLVSLVIAALGSFACVSRPDQQQAKEEPLLLKRPRPAGRSPQRKLPSLRRRPWKRRAPPARVFTGKW